MGVYSIGVYSMVAWGVVWEHGGRVRRHGVRMWEHGGVEYGGVKCAGIGVLIVGHGGIECGGVEV